MEDGFLFIMDKSFDFCRSNAIGIAPFSILLLQADLLFYMQTRNRNQKSKEMDRNEEAGDSIQGRL